MSIRDDFFAAQAKASLWDVAVSIKRGNPLPLDANAVYNALGTATVSGDKTTYTAGSLLEYAKTNPVAYPGQICAVVDVDKTTIYYPGRDTQHTRDGRARKPSCWDPGGDKTHST